MAINILTKSEKRTSELRDAVRLLAWDSYKFEHNLKGNAAFEGYTIFAEDWKEHEVHSMDLVAIEKFIDSLGYTTEEIMILRSETYIKKAQMNSTQSASSTSTSTAPSTARSTSTSTAPSTAPSTSTSTAPSTARSTSTSTAPSTAPSESSSYDEVPY